VYFPKINLYNLRDYIKMETYCGVNNEITKIIDGVYLGSKKDVENKETIEKYEIKNVISISDWDEKIIFDKPNVLYINVTTNGNIYQYFGKCFYFIERSLEKKQNILIHCKNGVHRSPTIIASYLMRKFSLKKTPVLDFIFDRRNIIDIPICFDSQLNKLEKKISFRCSFKSIDYLSYL